MTQTTTAHTRGPIKPRHPEFDFSGLPRRWFAGLAFPTHLANGANLLFPLGERFFVKSVRHFEKAIADDPALREAVRGFYAQEGRHAQAHEQYFDTLRAQGFDIDTFLKIYRTLAFDGLARLTGPELNLAITAALEHYTATLAEGALRDRMLDAAHPVMRALLLWHSAEEIEHKSVGQPELRPAHDRSRVRDGHPRRLLVCRHDHAARPGRRPAPWHLAGRARGRVPHGQAGPLGATRRVLGRPQGLRAA